jgi:S-adenosylmethionine-diacylglycerol 3-amino-3-carboxypropyl transferase
VHGAHCGGEALPVRSPAERRQWYDSRWDTWRWRWLFRLFFSRASLGALGTDPSFVRYGEESQAEQLLALVRRALVDGEPHANPYLHWILRGHYGQHLPLALRPEHFGLIRSRLDRLECRLLSLEDWLAQGAAPPIAGFNLSNVLEYVDPATAGSLLDRLHSRAQPGARLLLWNRLADRSTALAAPGHWQPLEGLAQALHHRNQVPFYRRLVVAEALPLPTPVPSMAAAAPCHA